MASHLGQSPNVVRRHPYLTVSVLLAVVVIAVVVVLSRPGADLPAVAAPVATSASPTLATPGPVTPEPEPSTGGPEAPSDAPAPDESSPSPDPEDEAADADVDLDPDFDVLDPVELDEDAKFEDGVQARLVALERTEVGAKGPGETAGGGVLVTIEIENVTHEVISLDEVVVDFYDNTDAPAVVNYGDVRTSVFSSTLAPGKSAEATYVARLAGPTEELSITVSYVAGAPAVSFSGKL